jgi:hypothetical protein
MSRHELTRRDLIIAAGAAAARLSAATLAVQWSTIDNFEWKAGLSGNRFGLV